MPEHASGPPQGDWLGTPYLRFEREAGLATCIIDRPERRNALTPAMYFGLRCAVDVLNADSALAGLLITGSGDVFCPGGDMSGVHPDSWAGLPDHLGLDNLPFEAIRHSAKPVVCALNGLTQGGGLMIAMLADVAVASDRATFRAPELLRGIADTYYAQVLPRQIGPARARDMLLTGRRVGAAQALAWGLISRVAPETALANAAREALVECCQAAPGARIAVKRAFDSYYGLFDRMAMEQSLAGAEVSEGFAAFSERRAPAWVAPGLSHGERL